MSGERNDEDFHGPGATLLNDDGGELNTSGLADLQDEYDICLRCDDAGDSRGGGARLSETVNGYDRFFISAAATMKTRRYAEELYVDADNEHAEQLRQANLNIFGIAAHLASTVGTYTAAAAAATTRLPSSFSTMSETSTTNVRHLQRPSFEFEFGCPTSSSSYSAPPDATPTADVLTDIRKSAVSMERSVTAARPGSSSTILPQPFGLTYGGNQPASTTGSTPAATAQSSTSVGPWAGVRVRSVFSGESMPSPPSQYTATTQDVCFERRRFQDPYTGSGGIMHGAQAVASTASRLVSASSKAASTALLGDGCGRPDDVHLHPSGDIRPPPTTPSRYRSTVGVEERPRSTGFPPRQIQPSSDAVGAGYAVERPKGFVAWAAHGFDVDERSMPPSSGAAPTSQFFCPAATVGVRYPTSAAAQVPQWQRQSKAITTLSDAVKVADGWSQLMTPRPSLTSLPPLTSLTTPGERWRQIVGIKLCNVALWQKFNQIQNEMVISKRGRFTLLTQFHYYDILYH